MSKMPQEHVNKKTQSPSQWVFKNKHLAIQNDPLLTLYGSNAKVFSPPT